ncbi:MAG TPA: hypothetical protein DCM14_01520 [Clostridiales bacterium UBA8153]|nr:hypothetical protein [Clostridiales bacterium UBA8153]
MTSCRRGAVAALVILFLPGLIGVLALVVDLGLLLHARTALQASADLAALAGVQELDLEALAQGTPRLLTEPARAAAESYAAINVLHQLGGEARAVLRMTVEVYNASPTEPLVHLRTGRVLEVPTVSVQLQLPLRLVLAPRLLGRFDYLVETHADAAVVRRR